MYRKISKSVYEVWQGNGLKSFFLKLICKNIENRKDFLWMEKTEEEWTCVLDQ